MRIMIDQAIPTAAGLFARLGEVHTFDGRSLQPADVADADALIVRSVTRVDADLLAGSQVRFVGTATSGTDHVDEAWLAHEGIQFAAARGCNARPVAEYVLTAILWLARQQQFDPRTKTLGVVGVGHTGSLVAGLAHALGMEVRLCDPPLQDAGLLLPPSGGGTEGGSSSLLLPPLRGGTEGGSSPQQDPPPPSPRRKPGVPPQSFSNAPSPQWLSQPQLLAQSDIITLHVPLTREGPHATCEMVNPHWLAAMKPGSMLINAARGEVVAESALIQARRGGRLSGLVVDVWTGEPAINEQLAAVCDIATPHIAGYSVEAKRRAVATIHEALTEWAGTSAPPQPISATPPPASRAIPVPGPVPNPAPVPNQSPDRKEGVNSHNPNGHGSDQSVPNPNRDRQRAATSHNRDRQRATAPHAHDLSPLLDPMESACPLSDIDAGLRTAIADGTLAERFDALRSAVSQRQEFPDHRLPTVQFTPAAAEYLEKVGFNLSERATSPQGDR